MRHKQYIQECKECGSKYIATRKGSQYCSGACRALASRKRKAKDGSKPKTVYVPTGRPVGRPRKNPKPIEPTVIKSNGEIQFQESDVWILLANVCVYYQIMTPGVVVSIENAKHQISELVKEFEDRFKCKFSDVKEKYPYASIDDQTNDYFHRFSKYANMKYSK